MIEVARQAYPDRDTLMRDLAELVADQLRAAHATKRPRDARRARRHHAGAVPRRRCREADLAWGDVARARRPTSGWCREMSAARTCG